MGMGVDAVVSIASTKLRTGRAVPWRWLPARGPIVRFRPCCQGSLPSGWVLVVVARLVWERAFEQAAEDAVLTGPEQS